MQRLLIVVSLVATWPVYEPGLCVAADPLSVESDFEGASVLVLEIDEATRSVSFMPGGDPLRGWPCWWYFRVDGISPGETITLRLRGSTATLGKQKTLWDSWAMPAQATFSRDGKTWQHTENGRREKQWMIGGLMDEGRMDVFLDLHNPAPSDPSFFYVLPREMLKESALKLQDRFIDLAYARISKIKPLIPMSEEPR